MTKKHFEALAVALAEARPRLVLPDAPETSEQRAGWQDAVNAVADVCAASNPRFNRERFVYACQTYQTAIRDGRLVAIWAC